MKNDGLEIECGNSDTVKYIRENTDLQRDLSPFQLRYFGIEIKKDPLLVWAHNPEGMYHPANSKMLKSEIDYGKDSFYVFCVDKNKKNCSEHLGKFSCLEKSKNTAQSHWRQNDYR